MTAAWEQFAACASADGDAWYPERGGDNGEAAKRICKTRCPVQQECLEDALAEETGKGAGSRFGIRGGLSPGQRHRLVKQQTTPQPQPAG